VFLALPAALGDGAIISRIVTESRLLNRHLHRTDESQQDAARPPVMRRFSMRFSRHSRRIVTISATTFGSVVLLTGCDEDVRDTVLSGVNSATAGLATTLIDAFFQSLQNDEDEQGTTTPAVKAIVRDGDVFA
jgi:hypothetical protein